MSKSNQTRRLPVSCEQLSNSLLPHPLPHAHHHNINTNNYFSRLHGNNSTSSARPSYP